MGLAKSYLEAEHAMNPVPKWNPRDLTLWARKIRRNTVRFGQAFLHLQHNTTSMQANESADKAYGRDLCA
jgi:hypothetical protein